MSNTVGALCAVVAAGQGVFVAIVLFLQKENRLPNRLIAVMLLVLAITLTEWALWWTRLIEQFPGLKGIGVGFPLLYGPLMLLFYRAVFEHKRPGRKGFLHFLPYAATLFFMLPFYLRYAEGIAADLKWIPPLTRRPWFAVIMFAHMIACGVWIAWRYKRYFLENRELRRWHRCLLAAYLGIILTYVLYRLLPYLGLTAQEWKYMIAFSLTLFIYLVAWLGYAEPRVFAGLPLREALTWRKYRKSSLAKVGSAALFGRVTALMEQEELYRDNSLSLDKLAQKLEVQRHHLSQTINEHTGKSFPEFINHYRVKAASQLLAGTNRKEMHVIEVAYAVGFNSKETFNLAFKNHTGMTPTEYRREKGKEV